MCDGLRVARCLFAATFLVATVGAQTSGSRASQAPAVPGSLVEAPSSSVQAPSSMPPAPTAKMQQDAYRKSDSSPDSWWFLKLAWAILLSGFLAALRVFGRFRRFSDLGIFRSWYSWSFIGFA